MRKLIDDLVLKNKTINEPNLMDEIIPGVTWGDEKKLIKVEAACDFKRGKSNPYASLTWPWKWWQQGFDEASQRESHKFAYILDTETTDLIDSEVIEVAHIRLSDKAEFYQRYKPSKQISFGAMATHHITEEELVNCEPSGSYQLPDDCKYVIGHKVTFDLQCIGNPSVKVIDTLPLAKLIFNDGQSYTQTACLYRIDTKMAKRLTMNAHNALADVRSNIVLFKFICDILGTQDLDKLVEITEKSRIPERIHFGQHNGMLYSEVPEKYKNWYRNQTKTDPYVLAAMNGAEFLSLNAAKKIENGF